MHSNPPGFLLQKWRKPAVSTKLQQDIGWHFLKANSIPWDQRDALSAPHLWHAPEEMVGASSSPWACSLSNVWNAIVNTLHLLHALPLKTFANTNNNATTHRAFVRINLLWSLESTALYHSHVITHLVYSPKRKKKKPEASCSTLTSAYRNPVISSLRILMMTCSHIR